MAAKICIPSNLRIFAHDCASVEVEASDVESALQELTERYPELKDKLLSETGAVHSFLSVFVGDRSIRDLEGLKTVLPDNETLLIVPALAGG